MDYNLILAQVNSAINDFGMALTFIKTDGVNVDSDKPWKSDLAGTDEASEYEAVGINVSVSSVSEMGFKSTTMDLLKKSERVFLVAPGTNGESLETYNFLLANGITAKIDVIDKLKPTNVTLLYVVGVAR